MRQFIENTLLLATHNKGKVEELTKLFEEYNFNIKSNLDFNLPEPRETENTFIGNARIKAHAAAKSTGLPSLSDDSGIEVNCLNGAPGVFTANWAETKHGRDFEHAMKKLWIEIQKTNSKKPYKASFNCTLVLAWPDGHDETFEGKIKGKLVWPIRGHNGHGFDPMFQPKNYRETFGEMDRWEKNKISHRGIAFNKFKKFCLTKRIKKSK